MKKRGLYLHYPFCSKICNYCDFAVSVQHELNDSYISALKKEILSVSEKYQDNNLIDTIYIGGGTPSLMPLKDLGDIVDLVASKFQFSSELEFSMELNPGSVGLEQFQEYKKIGLNRLSIGVQSFKKRELGILTRNHSPKSAIKAIENANIAGFDNISLDLMFSLPYQSKKSLEENLEIAVELPITHISSYSLIYEPNTKLYKLWEEGKIKKHGEEFDADLYSFVIEYLTSNDFEQYEVSNFAKSVNYCKHNLSAWHNGEYFAFGVSANGYLDNYRFANTKNLKDYISNMNKSGTAIESKDFIDEPTRIEEKFFLGLRADGINLDDFSFKKNFKVLLNSFINNRLIKSENDKISLTSKGYLLCDTITFKLLNELKHI